VRNRLNLCNLQASTMVSTTLSPLNKIDSSTVPDFVQRGSIVRTIWGDPDLVLLIFAGSAAEFALNKAVDWLFFTGEIPRDPIGRLFSTVRYAQEIVFVDEQQARRTLNRINAQHNRVENERQQVIPDWAYRDVLYMLIDYSQRAYELLYGPLSQSEKIDLFEVFLRIGEGLHIRSLPKTYGEWHVDRSSHLIRDLSYSKHTALLFEAYRRHLGFWRYEVLLQVQGVLVPEQVRRLLRLRPNVIISGLVGTYGMIANLGLQSLVHSLLIPPQYWSDIRKFDRR
jgi:ER-bound oxygenase mpaB/B'/Rubber oxygenase, catalytic domain